MLVQPDRNELGDKRLDPKESVAQKREECLAMAALKRLPGQDDLEDPLRALGPRIQFSEFVARLKRIVPALKVLDGSPGDVALYFPRTPSEIEDRRPEWEQEQQDRTLRVQPRQDPFFLHHKYVGGFPKEDIKEYSTLDLDNARLATKEHRGWRTVLMNLIEVGALPYRAAVKEFGDTGTDRRGHRWRNQMARYSN